MHSDQLLGAPICATSWKSANHVIVGTAQSACGGAYCGNVPNTGRELVVVYLATRLRECNSEPREYNEAY